MANRVVVKPNPDVVAPSVGIAPARAKPSFLGELASAVLPTVTGIAKIKGAIAGEAPNLSFIGDILNSREAEMKQLSDEGQLSEINVNAVDARHKDSLTSELLNRGIPTKFWSQVREQYKFGGDTSQFIHVDKEGDAITTTNILTGQSTFQFKSLEKAAAQMQNDIIGAIDPVVIEHSLALPDVKRETFLAPYIAASQKRYKANFDTKQRLAAVEGRNKLFSATKEQTRNDTELVFDDFDVQNRIELSDKVTDLSQQVADGITTPDQAKATLLNWIENSSRDLGNRENLLDMGRTATEYYGGFQKHIDAAVDIIGSLDPQKQLNREVLGKELLLREFIADTKNSLPDNIKVQFALSKSASEIAMSHFYIKSLGKEVPALAWTALAERSSTIVRDDFLPALKLAVDDPPDKDLVTGSGTITATNVVLGSLQAMVEGDYWAQNAATVEDTLRMYDQLKKLPSYEQVDPKMQKHLSDLSTRLYSVFKGDRRIENLLRDYVEKP
jgi:hypothetical protein